MRTIFLFTALFLFTSLSFAQTRNLKLVKKPVENPTSEKRKAVVIGMSDYGGSKSLDNTLNDADDMAGVLTKLGFEVTLLKENDLRSLRTNLSNWYNTIEGNDMAIFYFAGHGIEVAGQNYLIPVDAELNSQTDAQYNTLNVEQVLGNMDEKRVGMKLIILDACRDNPFTRSWSRSGSTNGLAQMRAPKGTYIAFAAAPGATAQDGVNYNLRNGVFTHYLKQEIAKEGLSIDEIFNNVADGVATRTHDQQMPFRNSSLRGNFYFIPKGNKPVPNPPAPVPYDPPVPVYTSTSDPGVVINGVRWATRNVAAPGTFASKPEDAGMFYQWNRRKAWPATGAVTDWDGSNLTSTTWEKANDPSPVGWRVPTCDEIKKLCDINKVSNEWTTINGVTGRKFTDKATGNSIFLPAAALLFHGTLNMGRGGHYWSGTQDVRYSLPGVLLFEFDDDIAYWTCGYHGDDVGFSVRAVAE